MGAREYGLTLGGFAVGRRLHYRLVHGVWCRHPEWTRGQIVEGARKLHWCTTCGHPELR